MTSGMTLRLAPPPHFNLQSVIHSHGWWRLPPFALDEASGTLTRVDALRDGALARYTLSEDEGALLLRVDDALTAAQQAELETIVARILGWELELASFYEYLADFPEYAWVAPRALGRKLKCPTVWEDAVKTLLTTNTTWAMTIQMVTRVAELGSRAGEGEDERIAFPTPQQLAELGEEALAAAVRAGYRNAYLYELATRITSGELDLEAWLADDADDADQNADRALYKRLRSLKGFGDYAVSSLMRIYGRFGYLSIDTVARACYKALYPAANELDAAALDATIRAHYATHGRWQALLQWVDVIKAFEEGLVG